MAKADLRSGELKTTLSDRGGRMKGGGGVPHLLIAAHKVIYD